MTFVVPLFFILIIYITASASSSDLENDPTPKVTPLFNARMAFKMFDKPIVVTPKTEYIETLFNALTNPSINTTFVNSEKEIADGLVKEYEGGVGFSLPREAPSHDSKWSFMVISETLSRGGLQWTDAARAVCDEIMNINIPISSQTFAHPAMRILQGSGGSIGYLYSLPFVTVGLMKGLILTIKLREARVGFLFTLNGVSEVCQSSVSLLISLIESLPTIIIGTLIFIVIKMFSSSDVAVFILAYLISVISYLFFTSGIITFLHSQKAFGIYLAIGIIIETGLQLIVQFGDYFPPGVLGFLETLFPFGNFIAIINHGAVYNGLQWDNLSLSVSGVSGSTQFICIFCNMLLNLIICILFNMCNPRPFGLPPIGWRRLFKVSAWKSLFKRTSYVEFVSVDVENVRKVYDKKIVAVDHIDLSIQQSECILCVGANGAGKSTLLEMLCGAREPTSGTITACGSNIFVETRAYHAILSIVFQDNALIPNYTTREHITLFNRLNGKTEIEIQQSIDKFVSLFKMRDFIDNFSDNLSGGSKRKLCIAIALLKNPQVLVCDEPCAGIDVEARQMIWRAISSYSDMTSFINVHSIDEAESMTSRILVMSQGRAKFLGTPAEMREEFKCGYEVAILDESVSMEDILTRVREIVPEVRVEIEHERTLLLPADLRVGAALEAIGEVNYIVHLDSMEITIRKMIEDDEAQGPTRVIDSE
jgi:ABC-type multidrug transport system ATPase subunit